MSKKNIRRISILVTAQTAYNLDRLAAMCGYREIGQVVDKLTREKMLSLRGGGIQTRKERADCTNWAGSPTHTSRPALIGRRGPGASAIQKRKRAAHASP